VLVSGFWLLFAGCLIYLPFVPCTLLSATGLIQALLQKRTATFPNAWLTGRLCCTELGYPATQSP
jgi:hypothetical protein